MRQNYGQTTPPVWRCKFVMMLCPKFWQASLRRASLRRASLRRASLRRSAPGRAAGRAAAPLVSEHDATGRLHVRLKIWCRIASSPVLGHALVRSEDRALMGFKCVKMV